MNLRQLFKADFTEGSEQQVFRVLFETYYDKAYKTIYIITRDREMSKDLTQETFIKTLKNINQLRDPAKFGAWLSAIASNMARDGMRCKKKDIPVEHIDTLWPAGQPLGQVNIMLPEKVIEEKELRSKVIEAMDELDDMYKQVVILKYYWDLSEKEIAESLEIKEGTVKSRLHRARAQMGLKLADFYGEEGTGVKQE